MPTPTPVVIALFKTDEGVTTRDGKSDSSTLLYAVHDSGTRGDAYTAVNVVAPAINPTDNLALQRISIDQAAKRLWIARCEYGVFQPLAVGEYTFSWDTTGATAHISVPISCTVYSVAGYTAPEDLKKVINADRDRRVQGTDVPAPSLKLTISYRLPLATVTLAYVRALSRMVGKCNNAAYAGFAAYELLFLGSTGRVGTKTDPTIDFHFVVGENLTSQTIGDITGVNKHAHDLIWPWFGEAKDSAANELITKPKALYVDEICEARSFANLRTDNVSGGTTTTTTAAP
jgi:hypothetical protein